jgi:hypothetical protein
MSNPAPMRFGDPTAPVPPCPLFAMDSFFPLEARWRLADTRMICGEGELASRAFSDGWPGKERLGGGLGCIDMARPGAATCAA